MVSVSPPDTPAIDDVLRYEALSHPAVIAEATPTAQAELTADIWVRPTPPETQSTPDSSSRPTQHPTNSADLNDRLSPTPLPPTVPDEEQETEPSPPDALLVETIEVTGNTVFSSEDLAAVVEPFTGRNLTLEEQRRVADTITQLYLDKDYITSRAVIEGITDGVLTIRAIEGRLGEIEVEGTERLNPAYVLSRIRLGVDTPFNAAKLEDQLRLLRADPLFENVEASLRPTGELNQSDLVVRVTEANPFEANFSIDNFSPPSVGSERLGVALRYRNLTGIGDEIAGSYYRSTTGGANLLDFSYRVPLNPMNGTLQLRVAPSWTKITQEPFDELDIRGNRQVYEINYRQPLVRTPREEFALSLGFTHQTGQTFIFDDIGTPFGIGPEDDGSSRTSVIELGQEYISRDPGGAWSLRSQFSFGTGLLDATTNDPPIPDGHFFSWLAQVQRVQLLGDDHLLIIEGNLQLTPNTLLPAQQFVIGGGQSLRGYRQNLRSGDNGFSFSVEDRITLVRNETGEPTLQIAPFLDMGAIWNTDGNPNPLPNQTFLMGAGLGLLWNEVLGLEGLSVRLDYGVPLIATDRGNNIQDKGFYFDINYRI